MPVIAATTTAFPPYYYPQDELMAALKQFWAVRHKNVTRLENFHRNMRVNGRYLAWPIEKYATQPGFGERNDHWLATAVNLGETAVCDLLDQSGLAAVDISQLTFTSVTGIAAPSVDARLMNRLAFAPSLKRVPLFGLGCVAGAAGVARVADYLRGHPGEAAVLLAVELCSLTIQYDDLSVANVISSGLFGDGAAAVLLVGDEHPLAREGAMTNDQRRTTNDDVPTTIDDRRWTMDHGLIEDDATRNTQHATPYVVASESCFFPDTEQVMGWEIGESGFKVVLSADVPKIAATEVRPWLDAFLARHNLATTDIAHWIAHPGGPKIIDALQEALGLEDEDLRLSRENLAQFGNLSSASVLSVLNETLTQQRPRPGDYGVMLAMGPGFCAEGVLLQWQ
jgi:alkylresorcinol/alkylpyrone synthase